MDDRITNDEVTGSSQHIVNAVLASVYDQWRKKYIYEGTVKQCSKYMDVHNEIGYNYSRMLLKKNGINGR